MLLKLNPPGHLQITIDARRHAEIIVVPGAGRDALRLEIEEAPVAVHLGGAAAQLHLAVVQEIDVVRLGEPAGRQERLQGAVPRGAEPAQRPRPGRGRDVHRSRAAQQTGRGQAHRYGVGDGGRAGVHVPVQGG